MNNCWHISVDTGGTFTDCVARDPSGAAHQVKVLSSSALRGRIREVVDPVRVLVDMSGGCDDIIMGFEFHLLEGDDQRWKVKRYEAGRGMIELDGPVDATALAGVAFEVVSPEPAPVLAARLVTQTVPGRLLPPMRMRLATTRGTNALLERRGAPVAFFVTKGFADLLRIGDQQRPDLFALAVKKREPLHEAVVEVSERVAHDGSVLCALDLDSLEVKAGKLVEHGLRTAAVALLNSYVNPAHEQMIAALLREVGFEHVSCSAELAPLIKILPRAETAVVDGYLSPVLSDYLTRVKDAAGDGRLHVMTSAGGLIDAGAYRACDSLLSGPAGGVAGAAAAGRASNFTRIIGLDMGGTSTDVARYDGDFEYLFEHRVGGVRLVAPALAIETVAAGGGSICHYSQHRLTVGPQSASADPGPACYGAGGPLTLTDVNLFAGRLDPDLFEIPIDRSAAERALADVCRQVSDETGERANPDTLLDGFLEIANQRMADAIGRISIGRGYDPADYALVAFGGAGGQHACAVARRLGMTTVIMPADASLLSAVGLSGAVVERFAQRQILQLLDDCGGQFEDWLEELARRAGDEVVAEGINQNEVVIRRRLVNLRLLGQETSLAIDVTNADALPAAFAERYRAMYGHEPTGKPIEVESIRVVVSSRAVEEDHVTETVDEFDAVATRTVTARFDGVCREVTAFERRDLKPGARIDGPALVFDRHSAFVIETGWRGVVDGANALILRHEENKTPTSQRVQPEVVRLELFTNRFTAIAGDMGQMLQRTALSTNVKERLDYSCAVLDGDGGLVVNAPHIPVHLGAMSLCVRALRESILKDAGPGDVVITNHPAFGGSHLPDITLVSPVFDRTGEKVIGYVANRAHHAEIGGVRPGSMPSQARSLVEEGVVIPPMYLLREGESRLDDLRRLLLDAPYPTRTVDDNLADIRAQLAANQHGAAALARLAAEHGFDEVTKQMAALQVRAEDMAREALVKLGRGRYEAEEKLDDGSPIRVRLDFEDGMARIDFTGSAPVSRGNLNATPAVVHAAVLYVMRLMIARPLPLNEGILRVVDLDIPPGMLNPPFDEDASKCPAVVGGNVETSQRIVDTLLKALGLCGCSQGTMNNIVFGAERFGYYETICGGCGATAESDGAAAVHSHMTNTRITDVEIVEHRYPVRIERFAIRRGSGGDGLRRGGDGVVREFVFGEAMELSVLSQHRVEGPFGMNGGEAGKPGRQRVIRADGEVMELGSVDGCKVGPGDRLIVETPGGGGYGRRKPAGNQVSNRGPAS